MVRFRAAVVASMAGTAIFAAVLVSGTGGPDTITVVDDVALLGAAALAAAACWFAVRTRAHPGERGWRLLAGALLSWAFGEAAWAAYEVVLGTEVPFPSVADAGYLAAPVLAAAGLAALAPARHRVGRVRAVLDGLIIATSVLLVSWVTVIGPTYREAAGTLVENLVSLAYPVADVVLIAMALLLLSGRARRDRLALGLVAAGLLSLALADSVYAYLVTIDAYTTGSRVDLAWFAGYLLIGLAALAPDASGRERAPRVRTLAVELALPYLAVALACAVALVHGLTGDGFDPVVVVCGMATVAFVIARQLVTLVDNVALTRELEAKVEARTAELATRAAQQEAVAALGARAVATDDLDAVLEDAAEVVAAALAVPLVAVLELVRPDRLVMRAGTGWCDEAAHLEFGTGHASQAGYTLESRAPVVATDLEHEDRFTPASAVLSHGGRSAITVMIGDPDALFGVLGAHARVPRDFGWDDVHVLEAVANIIAASAGRRRALDELRHQAMHDSLTGLPNRTLFVDRLAHALARCRRNRQQVAILFVDVDHFKLVNDSLGHGAGDRLLVAVAQRIHGTMRMDDTVARFSGDEFVVSCERVTAPSDAETVASRIAAALVEPFAVSGREVFVTVSTGIAIGDGNADLESLLAEADAAMYRAKAGGRGRWAVSDRETRAAVVLELELGNELRRGLQRGEIEVHYQPEVSIADGTVVGVEALARWRHPTRGYVPPSEFVPLAEKSDLVLELGHHVLLEACAQAAAWDTDVFVAVNLSSRQLADPSLRGHITDALDRSGLEPSRLCLEMTEGVLMDHGDAAIARLTELKGQGLRLAVDDFGTGYSSLAYLKRFPVDVVKIDRSFVSDLDSDDQDRAIVEAVIGMAHALQLEVVAEGVETAAQWTLLRTLGCDIGQGFLWSRPRPAAELFVEETAPFASAVRLLG